MNRKLVGTIMLLLLMVGAYAGLGVAAYAEFGWLGPLGLIAFCGYLATATYLIES